MSKPAELDLSRLERELRALLPVAISLGYREKWSSRRLSDKVVRVVMTCARLSADRAGDLTASSIVDLIPESAWIDLGYNVHVTFTSWRDRDKTGLIHAHRRPDDGEPCSGGIMFDLPGIAEAFPGRPLWKVVHLDPLTLTPSLLCSCGSHGFIERGRWRSV